MNIQDQLTQAIAEAAKGVLSKKESLKDYKPTRGGSKQDDFIDLHKVDVKDRPVEETEVEEGNEFTKAAAEAKLAGKEEFEFEGKTYPVEIGQEAAEKILGKNESVEELEEAVDNFFGFPTKDKLVKFQSMAKKLKIKPISNPTVLKRGGKEFHVMGFEGSVSDIEKAMKVAGDIIKEDAQKKTENLKEFGVNRLAPDRVKDGFGYLELQYRSSADIRDAESALKSAGIKARRSGDTLEIDSKSPAFKKAKIDGIMGKHEKARKDAVLKVLGEETVEEETIDEAIDPRKFALGGDTKATKRDVDAILSKIFMNTKLAKQVEDSEAYKAGYKSKGKGKNPYKKDTADFHLYILGQQSAQSE
jgi:hypothetical protein